MRDFLIVAGLLFLQGCAFNDAIIEVNQDPEMVATGPLTEVGEQAFTMGEFADEREDVARVGYKKNGYGMETADITTSRPVTEIVADAVAQGLEANGHVVGKQGIVVSGTVHRYWVDSDTNFWNIEVFSDLEVHLVFSDPADDTVIYDARYSGHGSDKQGMVTNEMTRDVLSLAVAGVVEEMALDEDLVDALREHRQAAR